MKVALVTGASRGLGAVIALALAEAGWAVAVNYASDTQGAEKIADTIRQRGGQAYAARFSVIDKEQLAGGLDEIRASLGPVDLIVNNATGHQPEMPLMEQSWRSYLDQLEFFVKAPLELLQAVLPDWRARKSGRIINIGSEVAELGNPNFGNYASAKGAMLAMTRSGHESWRRRGSPSISLPRAGFRWSATPTLRSRQRTAISRTRRSTTSGSPRILPMPSFFSHRTRRISSRARSSPSTAAERCSDRAGPIKRARASAGPNVSTRKAKASRRVKTN